MMKHAATQSTASCPGDGLYIFFPLFLGGQKRSSGEFLQEKDLAAQ
jgi:hypothetical protein